MVSENIKTNGGATMTKNNKRNFDEEVAFDMIALMPIIAVLFLWLWLFPMNSNSNSSASIQPINPKGALGPIGSKILVKYMQHVQGNEYEIGYTNKNGILTWMDMGHTPYLGYQALIKQVVVSGTVKAPFLLRNKNHISISVGQVFAVYTLEVPSGYAMQAGRVQVGKGESVQTQMITFRS